jgi:hypothetical protein
MVWVPENITGKFFGDVADAGPRPSGLAAPTAQSGGQPTDWVFYLPPLSLSVNALSSLISTLGWCKEKNEEEQAEKKEEKRKEKKKKKKGKKKREKKNQVLQGPHVYRKKRKET